MSDNHDLVHRVNEMVAVSIEARRRWQDGEKIAYGTSMTVVPDQAPGGFVPMLIIILHMPNPVEGQPGLMVNLLSLDVKPAPHEVSRMVGDGLTRLREQATAALDAATV